MKKIIFSMFMLAGIAANAQEQTTKTDTATPVATTETVKPDVRFLGKSTTTTTVTETRVGRRKKRRDARADANAAKNQTTPKDTISVKGDTIRVYNTDSTKTE